MKNSEKIFFLLLVVFILIFGFVFILKRKVALNRGWIPRRIAKELVPSSPKPTTSIPQAFCKRNEPFQNPSELTDSIQLVEDKLGEYLDTKLPSPEVQEKTKNWTNCINANFKNLPKGVGGVFIQDENTKVDNLPIFIDSSYKTQDELLRAILMAHEMRHAFQFLEFSATKLDKSCVDKEVEAFLTQFLFFGSLSESEKQSLASKVKKNLLSEAYAPLVNMYILSKEARSVCRGKGSSCFRDRLVREIESMIVSNPYYQKQCGL